MISCGTYRAAQQEYKNAPFQDSLTKPFSSSTILFYFPLSSTRLEPKNEGHMCENLIS